MCLGLSGSSFSSWLLFPLFNSLGDLDLYSSSPCWMTDKLTHTEVLGIQQLNSLLGKVVLTMHNAAFPKAGPQNAISEGFE